MILPVVSRDRHVSWNPKARAVVPFTTLRLHSFGVCGFRYCRWPHDLNASGVGKGDPIGGVQDHCKTTLASRACSQKNPAAFAFHPSESQNPSKGSTRSFQSPLAISCPPDVSKQKSHSMPPQKSARKVNSAKSPAKKKTPAKPSSKGESDATVEKNIRRIKKFYQIGQEFFQECEYYADRKKLNVLEKEYDLPMGIAGEYRTLANAEKGYSEEEMEGLYAMFRKAGRALTVTHLLRLISVKNRKKRSLLTKRALQFKWSTDKLRREVLIILGRRNPGGRYPQVPPTKKAAIQSVEEGLRTWRRWLEFQIEDNKWIEENLMIELTKLHAEVDRVYKEHFPTSPNSTC